MSLIPRAMSSRISESTFSFSFKRLYSSSDTVIVFMLNFTEAKTLYKLFDKNGGDAGTPKIRHSCPYPFEPRSEAFYYGLVIAFGLPLAQFSNHWRPP